MLCIQCYSIIIIISQLKKSVENKIQDQYLYFYLQ